MKTLAVWFTINTALTVTLCRTQILRKCRYVYSSSFDNCSNEEEENRPSAKRNRVNSSFTEQKMRCQKGAEICSKIFNVTLIQRQSFDEKVLEKIADMLERCCGECGRYMLTEAESLSHIDISSIDDSDIVFPVTGRASLDELYGFNFVPMFDVPGAYFFMREKTETEMAKDLIYGCLNMWTLFVACLLLAIMSGFVIWVFETSTNKEEFPREFYFGIFEGFWWSFVSMTTVGYGDRAPKSAAGRLYAVVWILIGITITSIYIASLASEIMDIRSPSPPSLVGKNIGCLKDRLHDATMIAQHGGILHDFEFNDTVYGVYDLMKKVGTREMDGFVINKDTYFYFVRVLKEKREKYKDVTKGVENIHLVKAELEYKKESLVTGMLMKSRKDFEYFGHYFEYNWPQIQTCDALHLNNEDKKVDTNVGSHLGGLFYPFLMWTLSMVGLIFVLGIIYEVRRRRFESHNEPETNIREKKPLQL